MLSAGSLGGVALANEFDLLSSPTPTRQYILDDAGVLNRTTKKSLNEDLTKLEVSSARDSMTSTGNLIMSGPASL